MRNAVNILLISVVLLLTWSCVRNESNGSDPERSVSQADVTLQLRIPISFGGSVTRAVDYMDGMDYEGKVKDVYAFIFDNSSTNKQLVAICRGYSPDPDQAVIKNNEEFVITVPADEQNDNHYKIVVLANVEEIIKNKFPSMIEAEITPSDTYTYATVMPRLYGPFKAKLFDTSPASINKMPMWGETSAVFKVVTFNGLGDIDPNGKDKKLQVVTGDYVGESRIGVSLLRSFARVDIGVGKASGNDINYTWNGKDGSDNNIPFILKEIYIVRHYGKFRVAPESANYTIVNNKVVVSTPTVCGKKVILLNDNKPSDTDAAKQVVRDSYTFKYEANTDYCDRGGIKAEIYLPESEIITASGSTEYDKHINRTAIVVGGEYGGESDIYYYRIDFSEGSDEKGGSGRFLTDVLRNRLYRVCIIGVRGPGWPTVKEAYESIEVDMTIEVIDWNEESISKDL